MKQSYLRSVSNDTEWGHILCKTIKKKAHISNLRGNIFLLESNLDHEMLSLRLTSCILIINTFSHSTIVFLKTLAQYKSIQNTTK